MEGAGYLAIWSDLAPQDETDWMHWITSTPPSASGSRDFWPAAFFARWARRPTAISSCMNSKGPRPSEVRNISRG